MATTPGLTQAALDVAFNVHDGEMRKCEAAGCYWALLHLVVAYPDICSSLTVSNPRKDIGARYSEWCRSWVKNAKLTGDEWWAMRNKLLHQGSAIPDASSRYARFSFSPPPATDHNQVDAGNRLHLNVIDLANEMRAAVARWRSHLVSTPPPPEATIVAKSLALVAVEYVEQAPAQGAAAQGSAVPGGSTGTGAPSAIGPSVTKTN
jgi:hypothetical protein